MWTTPVQWERNTIYLEDNPNISNDGNTLYFTAIYDTIYGGGYGSFDIWVSQRVNGVWQQPVNLGSGVNTAYHDANPSISSDGNILHFTSSRPGGYGGFDLYYSIRQNTSIENQQSAVVPEKFELFQNYPNPFNPETKIKYSVVGSRHVSLKIYDVLGREVATLVDEVKEAGVHNSEFRIYGELRRTIPHSELSSGVYFYQLRAGSYVETKKMLLLR